MYLIYIQYKGNMGNCHPEKANVNLSFASVDIGLFGKFLFWKKASLEFKNFSKQDLNENLRLFSVSILSKTGGSLKVTFLQTFQTFKGKVWN